MCKSPCQPAYGTSKGPESNEDSITTSELDRLTRALGSIVVRIPKELVDEEQIGEGELVELEVRKPTRDWFGAFPELRAFLQEEELDAHG